MPRFTTHLHSIPWRKILPILIVASPLIFFFVGIPFGEIVSDASTYDGFARNIVAGNGYSLDGTNFSALREPGYPLFLAAIFGLFGVGNYLAVYLIQALLLGLLGYMVYRIFAKAGEATVGIIAGFFVSLLPSYGLYTHTTGTELLFAFLVTLMFYLSYPLIRTRQTISYWRYVSIGLVAGMATIVRVQLVFFLPLLVLWFFWRRRHELGNVFVKCCAGLAIFGLIVGLWVMLIHRHTGTYALTSGRPELAFYTRAVRAQLSYADMTRYGYEWVARSLTGGTNTEFLYNNEYHKIGKDYWAIATSSESVAAIKKQSLTILRNNLGHYMYGNVIEALKTLYIEHDYSDVLNRYIRAGMYLVLYSLALFGLIMLWRTRKASGNADMQALAVFALIFIAYNLAILSPFDSIPRYNTPYLTFFAMIGFVGIALMKRTRSNKTAK